MRQKIKITALMAAALTGAALLSAEARNVVGYVKVEVPAGYSLISVPFEKVGSGAWTLGEVFAHAPEGCQVLFFIPGSGYQAYSKISETDWEDDEGNPANDVLLPRGAAFWVRNTDTSSFNLIIHGEVVRTPLVKELVSGLQLIGYGFPSEADLTGSGPNQPNDGDQLYEKTTNGYVVHTYIDGSGWEDDEGNASEMSFEPGRAYWYRATGNTTWNQTPNFSF